MHERNKISLHMTKVYSLVFTFRAQYVAIDGKDCIAHKLDMFTTQHSFEMPEKYLVNKFVSHRVDDRFSVRSFCNDFNV